MSANAVMHGPEVVSLVGLNPLAFPHQYGRLLQTETPAGFEDNYGEYFLQVVLTANQNSEGNRVDIDSDSAFIWRALSIQSTEVGNVRVRWKDPDGYYRQSALVPLEALGGTGNNRAPIFPEIFCPAKGLLLFDLREFAGIASTTVQLVLVGAKRRQANAEAPCETVSAIAGGGGARGGPYPGGGSSSLILPNGAGSSFQPGAGAESNITGGGVYTRPGPGGGSGRL